MLPGDEVPRPRHRRPVGLERVALDDRGGRETAARSAGTRSASFSIATSRPARSASAAVSPPGPGPISSTVSSGPAPSASAMRPRSRGSVRKCCPSRRLARGTARSGGRAACGRRSGCAPNASASASTASHDRLGRLGAEPAHLGQQPLLAERLAVRVPRVHQPVGPEHQQVVIDRPRHLPPLDASRRREPERRRGGLEPLGLAEPGHAKRVRMTRVGVGEPAGERIEHAVEHAEVHLGRSRARSRGCRAARSAPRRA